MEARTQNGGWLVKKRVFLLALLLASGCSDGLSTLFRHPNGPVPPTTAPAITAFILTSGAQTGDPVITFTLEGTDDVAVTGWLINESATTPPAEAAGWVSEKPSSYTLSAGYGTKTVYAWAKDADGNVSSSLSLSVTYIVVPSGPTITTFVTTETGAPYVVTATIDLSVAGTDDYGITGWMIKEDDTTAPLAADPGWLASAPVAVTLTGGYGTRVLSLWAKDGDGNMSARAECSVQYIKDHPAFRIKLTVPAAEVSEPVTDFPVYLDLASLTANDPNFFSRVRSDGGDILVTAADGSTALMRELVYLDTVNQKGELWFKAPALSNAAANEFYLYYNYPLGTQANSTGVWSNGFVAVYHLQGTYADSTANGIGGTASGSVGSAPGPLGLACSFDGVSYITLAASPLMNMAGSGVTVSLWYKPSGAYTAPQERVLFEHTTGWLAGNYQITSYYNNPDFTLAFGHYDYEDAKIPSISNYMGTWHYATGVYNSASPMANIYDKSVGVSTSSSIASSPIGESGMTTSYIGGRQSDSGKRWQGDIDEVRIANVPRSAGWIQIEYNNQSDPAAFLTLGASESVP